MMSRRFRVPLEGDIKLIKTSPTSPGTPPAQMARAVTRSQSRERDPSGFGAGQKTTGREDPGVDRLPVVAEEPPKTPGVKAFKPRTSVVPESPGNPEGHSALSGTTVVHHVSDSENELDALDMVDELPDLQQAAGSLLDLLISNNSDPMSILNAAKRARDTDAKRVKRHSKKLFDRMNVYGQGPFIDAPQVKRLIPSVGPEDGLRPWSPSPALHISNCARLALDILLEKVGSNSTSQAIRSLESQFPVPFMDQITDGTRPISVGTSAAEKSTFELALEIRTQFLIMELERRQNEPEFSARSILIETFYSEFAFDSNHPNLDSSTLRGFKLVGAFEDENGCLPDRFQDAVAERIRELEVELFDDDDALNIKGLRAAFSWKRFVLRTANFIHQREKEIRHDLQTQAHFDEIKGLVVQEIRRRSDPNWIDPAAQRGSVAPSSAQRSSRTPWAPETQAALRQQSTEQTPERRREQTALMLRTDGTPRRSIEHSPPLSNHVMPPHGLQNPTAFSSPQLWAQHNQGVSRPYSTEATPQRQKEFTAGSHGGGTSETSIEQGNNVASPRKPVAKHVQRRKSAKRYLNVESIGALTGRRETSHQQNLSHLESQYKTQSADMVGSHVGTTGAPNTQGETRDEIPQTQETNAVVPDVDDGSILLSQEDPLDLPGSPQPQAAIPPESPQNDQVNRDPGRWFDAPQASQPQAGSVSLTQKVFQDIERSKQENTQDLRRQRLTFYDRQTNARRVSPIHDFESPSSEKQPHSAGRIGPRKRPREEIEESDDDFESISRDSTSIANRRAQKPQQERRVRARTDEASDFDPAGNQLLSSLDATYEEATTQSKIAARPQPRTQSPILPLTRVNPPPTTTVPPEPQNEWERRNTANANRPPPELLKYSKWSAEEDAQLIRLIAVHGPKWADIQREDLACPAENGGPKFTIRGRLAGTKLQISLKDRARTLKKKFIREGTPLPPRFDEVSK